MMLNWIRYKLLMRRLRSEIAEVVAREKTNPRAENSKSAFMTACKAYGNIV